MKHNNHFHAALDKRTTNVDGLFWRTRLLAQGDIRNVDAWASHLTAPARATLVLHLQSLANLVMEQLTYSTSIQARSQLHRTLLDIERLQLSFVTAPDSSLAHHALVNMSLN